MIKCHPHDPVLVSVTIYIAENNAENEQLKATQQKLNSLCSRIKLFGRQLQQLKSHNHIKRAAHNTSINCMCYRGVGCLRI
jgi:hypothetical protein